MIAAGHPGILPWTAPASDAGALAICKPQAGNAWHPAGRTLARAVAACPGCVFAALDVRTGYLLTTASLNVRDDCLALLGRDYARIVYWLSVAPVAGTSHAVFSPAHLQGVAEWPCAAQSFGEALSLGERVTYYLQRSVGALESGFALWFAGTGSLLVPESYSAEFAACSGTGTLRNNYNGWVGVEVVVGAADIVVSSLGRWKIAGNSRNHALRIVHKSTGAVVGSGTVELALGAVGTFNYVKLSYPAVLQAGQSYHVQSLEAAGLDTWFDDGLGCPITTSSVAFAVALSWTYLGGPISRLPVANRSLGAVGFQYVTGYNSSADLTLPLLALYGVFGGDAEPLAAGLASFEQEILTASGGVAMAADRAAFAAAAITIPSASGRHAGRWAWLAARQGEDERLESGKGPAWEENARIGSTAPYTATAALPAWNEEDGSVLEVVSNFSADLVTVELDNT